LAVVPIFTSDQALDRLHQADIALGNHFRNRQAVAAIAHGDLGDQAEMAGDELVRGFTIALFAPAARQHVFLLRFQHREPADFV
jgi:lipid-binding SYLF domain-containing protein